AKAVRLASALAAADLALGACWAVPVDVAPDHAGVVTGFMNTLGNLGGLIGPLVVGIAVDRWHSWTFPFYVTAAIYTSGGIAWLTIDPEQRIGRASLQRARSGNEPAEAAQRGERAALCYSLPAAARATSPRRRPPAAPGPSGAHVAGTATTRRPP